MAKYVLQPCKVRDGWIVPLKGSSPVDLDWARLCQKFLATTIETASKLQLLRLGAYVGLITSVSSGTPICFVLINLDNTGKVTWLLQKDPTFESRLQEVYRVDDLQWDAAVAEG